MGQVAISTRVQLKNDMGRYVADCSAAAGQTIAEAILEGAALSRSLAPVGSKDDLRSIPLAQSIDAVQESRTKGFWGASARHALFVEKGTGPHDIPSRVSFFWEAAGRPWMWPETYERRTGYPGADPINHPGADAQPYLEPAYQAIRRRLLKIMKKHYPG